MISNGHEVWISLVINPKGWDMGPLYREIYPYLMEIHPQAQCGWFREGPNSYLISRKSRLGF